MISERLESGNFYYFIYKKEIIEKIFNDEIVLTSISSKKSNIPDFASFFIASTGSLGLDEFEMLHTEINLADQESMFKEINDFESRWKLDLDLKLVTDDIQNIYKIDTDINRKNYDSEINFIIETQESFIYFFTNHLYY